MLNVYQFHDVPTSLAGYKENPTMNAIVSALMRSMKNVGEQLHSMSTYDPSTINPPYDVLCKYADDFEYWLSEYDTISIKIKHITGEIIVTHQVVKGYVNDIRVESVPVMDLSVDDTIAGNDAHLHKFQEQLLQYMADALGRK
jgi:hypothetical protein